MNALELLKSDHQKVSDLFEQLQQTPEMDQKRDIFDTIRDELMTHSRIEEIHFYPLFQSRDEFKELIGEALDEHSEVRDLLDEIESMDDESDIEDRFDELQEAVEHHVDEEENELFPRIRQIMNEKELEELGRRLMQEKQSPSRAA